MNPDYSEWLLGAPDEIISASTTELLEYFLKSPFMGQRIYSCSSVPDYNEIDFSCHKAFRELISREDCIDTLENYAGNILRGAESAESDKIGFAKLLTQPSVKTLIDDLADTATDYPNLRNMYTAAEAVSSAVGDFAGRINGIEYYVAGTISTANNLDVEVCTPYRELSPSEITNINNQYDYDGNFRMSEPSAVYNCHSYAIFMAKKKFS